MYFLRLSRDLVDAEGDHIGFERLAVGKGVYIWVSVCEQAVRARITDQGVRIVGRAWEALWPTDH